MQTNLSQRLAEKRQILLQQSALQRRLLQLQQQHVRQTLNLADMAWRTLTTIKQRPAIAAGLLAAMAIIKPRGIFPLLRKAAVAWNVWRQIEPVIARIKAEKNKLS